MDDININSGSDTPVIDPLETPVSESNSPITTSNQITDTLAAAIQASESNELSVFHKLTLAAPLGIVSWSQHITSTSTEAKHQRFSDETENITALTGMRINTILTAEGMIELQSKLYQIASDMETLYQQQLNDIAAINNGIITYNNQITQNTNQDQAQIDAMNQATITYNASDQGAAATATYNQAIATYNTYVSTTRVDNYNNAKSALNATFSAYVLAVAAQNAQIDQINISRDEAGLPPLPHVSDNPPNIPAQPNMPNPPSPNHSVAIDSATIPTPVSSVSVPAAPPSGIDLIMQYLAPLFNALGATIQADTNFYDTLTRLRDFARFYLGPLAGKVSILPASYIDRAQQVFLDSSTGVGSGSGASLASIISGLSSPNLNRLLANSIATDAAIKANLSLPNDLVDTIRLINIGLLSRAGLAASLPALGILAEKAGTIDINSPTLQIALSLSFINQISHLNESDDIKNSLLKQLKDANPLASASQLEQLAIALAAAAKLSLSLFSLSLLSQSLHSPELTSQLVGLINAPPVTSALQSASANRIDDILNNPSGSAHLREDLANHLSGLGTFSQSTADGIAKSLVLDNINTEDELKASLTKQLIAKDVAADDAKKLANRAAEFVQSEINGANLLDTAIQRDTVNKDYLSKELLQQGINKGQIDGIVSDITNNTYTSRRELQNGITNSLVNSGTPFSIASQIASHIALNGQSAAFTYLPTSNTDLAATVTSQITNQTSADYGNIAAQELGNRVATALLEEKNPLSVVNSIQTHIQELHSVDDAKVAENLRAFLKPNYDLFSFSQKMMDPANNLILSMLNGPMYSGNNIKHTGYLDILV